jgi:hypothetical protein
MGVTVQNSNSGTQSQDSEISNDQSQKREQNNDTAWAGVERTLHEAARKVSEFMLPPSPQTSESGKQARDRGNTAAPRSNAGKSLEQFSDPKVSGADPDKSGGFWVQTDKEIVLPAVYNGLWKRDFFATDESVVAPVFATEKDIQPDRLRAFAAAIYGLILREAPARITERYTVKDREGAVYDAALASENQQSNSELSAEGILGAAGALYSLAYNADRRRNRGRQVAVGFITGLTGFNRKSGVSVELKGVLLSEDQTSAIRSVANALHALAVDYGARSHAEGRNFWVDKQAKEIVVPSYLTVESNHRTITQLCIGDFNPYEFSRYADEVLKVSRSPGGLGQWHLKSKIRATEDASPINRANLISSEINNPEYLLDIAAAATTTAKALRAGNPMGNGNLRFEDDGNGGVKTELQPRFDYFHPDSPEMTFLPDAFDKFASAMKTFARSLRR